MLVEVRGSFIRIPCDLHLRQYTLGVSPNLACLTFPAQGRGPKRVFSDSLRTATGAASPGAGSLGG